MSNFFYQYFGGRPAEDSDLAYGWRARVFAYACLFCAIALLATATNHFAHSQPITGALLSVAMVAIAALPLTVADPRTLRRASTTMVGLSFLSLFVLCVGRGGLNSAIPMTFVLIPVLAGILNGPSVMTFWAALVVASILLLGFVPPLLDVELVDRFSTAGKSFSLYFAPILFTLTTGALIRMMLGLQEQALDAARTAERERLNLERSAQERRTEQLAMVGRLAVGVAHEVNNPLSYVVANVDYATSVLGGDDPEQWKDVISALGDASDGARRIGKIVTQLNAHGRVADDQVTSVRLQESVETALRIANNQIRHRAGVVRRFAANPFVKADSNRLTQVFLNLLINATHAIAAGDHEGNSIVVTIDIDEEGRAYAEISDTGEGIDPAVLPRITEPFFTTKELGAGSGLGLSISQSIVVRYGGMLDIESELGVGTSVRVSLPACARGPLEKVEEASVVLPIEEPRILVIDDEERVRRGLIRMLPGSVTETSNVADALAKLDEDSAYDVILCDVMMPDATGVDFYKAVERRHAHLVPRIVMLTGGVFDGDTSEFLRESSVTVWSKPMLRQELLVALAGFLRTLASHSDPGPDAAEDADSDKPLAS